MRHYFPIIVVFLSVGCGGPVPTPCTFTIQGLCVDTGDHPVDQDLLSSTIDIENAILQEQYQIDIVPIFSKWNVLLRYVDHIPGEYRGVTRENSVQVKFSSRPCSDTYYVAAHELLHVFAEYALHADLQSNFEHNVGELFFSQDRRSTEGDILDQLIPFLISEGCYIIK